LIVASRLRPVPAEGARLALDAGTGARRLPVVPTLIAAATGMAVATGALVVAASLSGLFHDGSRYGRGWDLEVSLPTDDATFDAQARAVAEDHRVTAALQVRAGELRVPDTKGMLELPAVGYQSLRGGLTPIVLEGRPPASADEIMLGTDTLRHAGLHIGDLVQVSGPSVSTTARIVGRTVLPDVGSVTSDDGVVVPMAMHRRLQSIDLVAGLDDKAAVLLRVPEHADEVALRADLEAKGYLVDEPVEPGGIVALRDIGLVATLLALITAVIVTVATGHAVATAVRRRGGELAVLRALGLRPSQVRRAITCQALAVVAAASAVGVPVGLAAGRLVWGVISAANRVLPVVDVPVLEITVLAVALGAIALAVSVGPGRRASRMAPAAALTSE
jgi:hypothetical protein